MGLLLEKRDVKTARKSEDSYRQVFKNNLLTEEE